ncbi:mitochondrial escape protein 2 [Coniosporium tulheliwenetii]|uniref:Mitochondrial escape protein 2 n=1 Tax=Coniosporium tulheliwenetii TaxID=3383036 RepID=A0ACC2Z2N8_9PEZI|nr:mitochondrial escape protein 2 [Cladosporium sp. JES 115]
MMAQDASDLPRSYSTAERPNEGILFFGNVLPLRLQWLLRLPFHTDRIAPEFLKRINDNPTIAAADPVKLMQKAMSGQPTLQIKEVLPRLKEGGAFVKFSHDASASPSEVEAALKAYLKEKQIRPWWNPFQRIRAALVRGRPWVEDLYRLPSARLKAEFLPSGPGEQAAELSQEQLYSFFRPYGKLADIIAQPADSKIVPRFAYLDFADARRAIMAKNCMHGYKVLEEEGGGKAGTIFRLTYERKAKPHWIRDWFFNHPELSYLHWRSSLPRSRDDDDAGMEAIWDDRKDLIEQIQTWLLESVNTFIIVQGPRGSGKRDLVVDQALKHKRYKVIIDCKPIQEARGDSATINAAAAQVGYKPVFSWMNSISGMIDMAAQGATGVKTGFSETLDSQLTKIWNNTATALKQIALDGRKKDDKDAHLGDDEWLEAHPERLPTVVIDNFLHKSQEGSIVYDKIAEWAAGLITANVAHVIILTNDVSYSKSLSKALPNRVFREISLSDCSLETAKRFVITHLDAEDDDLPVNPAEKHLPPSQRRKDLHELDDVLPLLGGRLTDVAFLANRLKSGETPSKAVREIRRGAALDPEQAWHLIRTLAAKETLRYNEILLADTYKSGGEKVLQALEQAELISIVSVNGRPHSIRPGKPVYLPAFRLLHEDRVLRSRLDLALLNESIKLENASIEKYEAELRNLAELPKQPAELAPRVKWLLGKVEASQAKVEGYESESNTLKKVLVSEY